MAGWGWDGWSSRPLVLVPKVTFTSPIRRERRVSPEYTRLLELRYPDRKSVSSSTMRSDHRSEVQEPCLLSTPAPLQNEGENSLPCGTAVRAQ